jgi:hypothetical protein
LDFRKDFSDSIAVAISLRPERIVVLDVRSASILVEFYIAEGEPGAGAIKMLMCTSMPCTSRCDVRMAVVGEPSVDDALGTLATASAAGIAVVSGDMHFVVADEPLATEPSTEPEGVDPLPLASASSTPVLVASTPPDEGGGGAIIIVVVLVVIVLLAVVGFVVMKKKGGGNDKDADSSDETIVRAVRLSAYVSFFYNFATSFTRRWLLFAFSRRIP